MNESYVVLFLMFLITIFLFLRKNKSKSKSKSKSKGIAGEVIVSKLLSKLPPDKYKLINNITLKTNNGTTQIDHVLLSKYGVFVIETKNMSGELSGNKENEYWSQNINQRSYEFYNPIKQNYKHIKTIERLINIELRDIISVVVFVGNGKFETTPPENVFYGTQLIEFIQSKKKELYNFDDICVFYKKIDNSRLYRNLLTDSKHKQHVKSIPDYHRVSASFSNRSGIGAV